MSQQQKTVAQWAAVALTAAGLRLTGAKSAAAYGALEQRVSRMESDRAQADAELRAIRILVTRLCAVTPGCGD